MTVIDWYLTHVDFPHSQSLVTENGSVLVLFPPLQHDLQLVPLPFQEVWVLQGERQLQLGVKQTGGRQRDLVAPQGALAALHLHCNHQGGDVGLQLLVDGKPCKGERAEARYAVGGGSLHLPGGEQFHGHGGAREMGMGGMGLLDPPHPTPACHRHASSAHATLISNLHWAFPSLIITHCQVWRL